MRIAILGPTASGKSSLAVEVARHIGGTVVNGDPFQAIQGLAIGTGQPSEEERQGVPHLGYGVLPLSARLNPAGFGLQVQAWLASVERPVLVTGSGLYLRGIWGQLTELPDVPLAIVERVRRWSAELGVPRLHRLLACIDPQRAAELHPNDAARVTRALALHRATGLKPSKLLTGVGCGVPEGWRVLMAMPERGLRRLRVEARVAEQLKAGWRMEVASLLAAGHRGNLDALRPLGYAQLLADEESGAAVERTVQATQAYAKRQATWFRNQFPGVPHWNPDTESLVTAFEKLGLS